MKRSTLKESPSSTSHTSYPTTKPQRKSYLIGTHVLHHDLVRPSVSASTSTRNKTKTTSEPHKQTIPKAIWTLWGSRHNIPCHISNRTPTPLEDTQRLPHITSHTLSGDRSAWTKFHRTTTRHHRR